MNTPTLSRGLLVAALAVLTAQLSPATIVETDSFSNTQTAFDSLISNTDLINTGQPSLASASQSIAALAGSVADSHDGSTTPTLGSGAEWVDNNGTAFTYLLNISGPGGSASGYTINSIRYINAWSSPPNYSHQAWDLQIATLSNPSFTTIKSVAYAPGGQQATMVSLTDSTGQIATGVTGLRFVLNNALSDRSVLEEIDVFGSPVPEPASVSLLALGGWLLFRRRFGAARA